MKRRTLLTGAGAGLLVARRGEASSAVSEKGFVPLFDGRTLDGWAYGTKKDGEPRKVGEGYAVVDGAIVCSKESGGDLYTEAEYGDFVFRFEFRLSANANNGIGIRTPMIGDAAYVGMEIQVLDDGGDQYKTLRPAQYHGSIYDVVPARRGHQRRIGQWNQEEITARGPQITVRLNGKVIVDANVDDVKDEALRAKHPGLANRTGHIGLLGHGTTVEFRRLRIKSL
jgi:hypothetical protein